MLEQFTEYFDEIELPQPMREKAEQLFQCFADAIASPLQSVFISDTFESDGARRYHAFWARTPLLVLEAKNFVAANNLDFTPLRNIEYTEFARSDLVSYESGPTTATTTLICTVRFSNSVGGRLMAAHNNCKYLYRFARQNLLPSGQG